MEINKTVKYKGKDYNVLIATKSWGIESVEILDSNNTPIYKIDSSRFFYDQDASRAFAEYKTAVAYTIRRYLEKLEEQNKISKEIQEIKSWDGHIS